LVRLYGVAPVLRDG